MSDFDPRTGPRPFDFRPWPPGDPVPWENLFDILDRATLLNVFRIKLQFSREVIALQTKALADLEKALPRQ